MEQEQNIGLNLVDLKNTLSVIDYAASQGAFKGWETITQVLQVREKLAAFLKAAEEAEEAQKAAAGEEGPELNFVEPEEEEKPKKRTRKSSK